MTETPDDGFTELYDADIDRIDLVGKGANGLPFLIAKSSGALLEPSAIRDLIGDEPPEHVAKGLHEVSITGSPSAIAEVIHQAALRARTKENTMGEPVAKADDVTDLTEPLPAADDVVDDLKSDDLGDFTTGDPDDPSSAAWEAVDSARAGQAIDLVLALQRLLEQARDRENQEVAVSGDEDDACASMTLSDAISLAEMLLGLLAPFAVSEAAEAADRVAEREALAKGQIAKAGRVLSSANEGRVQQASSLLQEVLATLPAPVETDTTGVAKEGAAMEPKHEEVTDVAKAKGDPQMAVFDADGKLVGTIDPGDLSPIAATEPPSGGDAEGDGAPADDAPAADGTEPVAAAAADPTAPPAPAAPAAAADDDTVMKEAAEALGDIVKAALKPLQDEVAVLKAALEAPAEPRVVSNGVPAPVLRGQDKGAPAQVDIVKAAELREQFNAASTVEERDRIAKSMGENAAALIADMFKQRRGE
ncbi:MAG: hypothetical protein ACTHMS_13290 [Jatrophihabitans sp.]|uniref:hypothetical protein n=1 Tax=Jatrophihabitans sp. TaxID=1932789 RepID=UPI003F7F7B60